MLGFHTLKEEGGAAEDVAGKGCEWWLLYERRHTGLRRLAFPGPRHFLSEAPLEVVLRFFEESDRQRKADLIP